MRIILALLLSSVPAWSASWYLDNELATGSNNGTNWANAWRNPTNVVWSTGGVVAGDTLYVSGGTTTKVYTNNLVIAVDGTHNNYVTVRPGQDAGHNGVAVFTNAGIIHNTSRPKWRWINGSRSDAFVAPTNHQQVYQGATAITNNIGFRLVGLTGTNDSDTSPTMWYYRNPDGMRHSWIEVSGMTNTGSFEYAPHRGTVCYMDMSDEAGDPTTNNVFEYLYLYDNAGQQFSKVSGTPVDYDDFVWKFCNIYKGGEDHFELGSGITIRDSVIGPVSGDSGHVDLFQFTGDKFKVYNNDIRESFNAVLRLQTQGEGDFTSDFYFFNNIVTEKVGRSFAGGTQNEFITFVHWDSQPQNGVFNGGYSNIVIANNLIYNSVTNTAGTDDELCANAWMNWSPGTYYTNKFIYGLVFVNNLVVDKEKGTGFPTRTVDGGKFQNYTTNDVWVDYNSFAATNTQLTTPRQVVAFGEDIVDGSSSYSFSNNTNYPAFADKENDDFELASTDTVALNTGYDMSAYFTFDALNRPRDALGAWDRGPLELQQDPNLIVYLSFDDETAGGNATDSSGNSNHGVRFTYNEDSYPSNRAIASIGGTTLRPTGSGNAVDFLWATNGGVYGFYGRDAGYFGITNVTHTLSNMSTFTVMCWARYNRATRVDATYDYSVDQAAMLVCGGSTATGKRGAWELGRRTQDSWINNTRMTINTNNGTTGSFGAAGDRTFGDAGNVVWNYPDRGFDNNGDTTNWHHYAFTFTNGVGVSYFDGVPYGTNDISGTTTTLNLGRSASRPYDWVGIGVNTHVGTPEYDAETGEDYPNYAFMNGGIDQVRIYSTTLSHQQIVNVANSEGAAFADAPSEGGGGGFGEESSFTRSKRTGKQVGRGKVVWR